MHELSICVALLEKVESIAREQGAAEVERILLQVGPLSGVEPSLLTSAFTIAASGTLAESAALEIEATTVELACDQCGAQTTADPNRLLCGQCGGFRTRVVSGDEMLLARLELRIDETQDRG